MPAESKAQDLDAAIVEGGRHCGCNKVIDYKLMSAVLSSRLRAMRESERRHQQIFFVKKVGKCRRSDADSSLETPYYVLIAWQE